MDKETRQRLKSQAHAIKETTRATKVYACGHAWHKTDLCKACRKERRVADKAKDAKRKGRLPDKSSVLATYDAATETWVGDLRIEGVSFTGKGGGLLSLLRWLDGQYRKSLKKPRPPRP